MAIPRRWQRKASPESAKDTIVSVAPTPYKNRLLQTLSVADQEALRPWLRWSELGRGRVLVSPNERIQGVWFLEAGLNSIVAIGCNSQSIEVGISGRDGLVGVPVILDADRTPHRIFMQVAGHGYYVRVRTR